MKIRIFDYPTVVWCPLSKEPPQISAQTLYCQKLLSLGYIFVADSIDQSSFKFSRWAPKDARVFETEFIMSLQGHPRSLILVPIESALPINDLNSNLGHILPRFRDITAFVCRKPLFRTPPGLFRRKFWGVPLGVDPWCLGCKDWTSQANWWRNYFRRIPTSVITIHQRHRWMDRQTDDMRLQDCALH